MALLQEEARLDEIVRLVGVDSLDYRDRLTLDVARSIREDYLHQVAFHDVDTYTSLDKQFGMLKAILKWYDRGLVALSNNVNYNDIIVMEVLSKIGRMKYIEEQSFGKEIQEILEAIDLEYEKLEKESGE